MTIDEIGLAEISPFNPLKLLHSLLEPTNPDDKVPFVAISNWILDASKQNRAISLSRPLPGEKDLKESIYSIAEDVCKKNNNSLAFEQFNITLLDKLVATYLHYMDVQTNEFPTSQTMHHKNFHGLRDFY